LTNLSSTSSEFNWNKNYLKFNKENITFSINDFRVSKRALSLATTQIASNIFILSLSALELESIDSIVSRQFGCGYFGLSVTPTI